MRKAILIILAISFYPFGCEGQNTNPTPGACDTVFIESPEWESERETFNQMIIRLTDQNKALRENVASLDVQVTSLKNDVTSLNNTVKARDASIVTLTATIANKDTNISDLERLLVECKSLPPDTVTDTVYVDVIVEVIPPSITDEVLVSHCDSTKFTTWFHYGGVSGYPHDISFATKEFGMVRVTFNDSLTNEIKVQPQYTLKRTKDFENARTLYEFVK